MDVPSGDEVVDSITFFDLDVWYWGFDSFYKGWTVWKMLQPSYEGGDSSEPPSIKDLFLPIPLSPNEKEYLPTLLGVGIDVGNYREERLSPFTRFTPTSSTHSLSRDQNGSPFYESMFAKEGWNMMRWLWSSHVHLGNGAGRGTQTLLKKYDLEEKLSESRTLPSYREESVVVDGAILPHMKDIAQLEAFVWRDMDIACGGGSVDEEIVEFSDDEEFAAATFYTPFRKTPRNSPVRDIKYRRVQVPLSFDRFHYDPICPSSYYLAIDRRVLGMFYDVPSKSELELFLPLNLGTVWCRKDTIVMGASGRLHNYPED